MNRRISQSRLARESRGASSIEFALVLTLLLMIVLGVIQFGLCWYTKYALACASREGARYGVLWHTDNNNDRIIPNALTPSIETVVRDYLTGLCPSLSQDKVTVTPSGPAFTSGTTGTDLTVTVTCQNPWNLLGPIIPSLNNLTFSAETTMRCE